jgi:hypothetical protein
VDYLNAVMSLRSPDSPMIAVLFLSTSMLGATKQLNLQFSTLETQFFGNHPPLLQRSFCDRLLQNGHLMR